MVRKNQSSRGILQLPLLTFHHFGTDYSLTTIELVTYGITGTFVFINYLFGYIISRAPFRASSTSFTSPFTKVAALTSRLFSRCSINTIARGSSPFGERLPLWFVWAYRGGRCLQFSSIPGAFNTFLQFGSQFTLFVDSGENGFFTLDYLTEFVVLVFMFLLVPHPGLL